METVAAYRRLTEDRRRTRRFVLRDRRSGFERRRSQSRGRLGAALDGSLTYLRDHPRTLVEILALVNLLSLLDLGLTLILLRLGVTEANPVMRYLLAASATQAALVKAGIVAAATLAIWVMRRRRAVLKTALFVLGLYGAVVLYELAGLAQLR